MATIYYGKNALQETVENIENKLNKNRVLIKNSATAMLFCVIADFLCCIIYDMFYSPKILSYILMILFFTTAAMFITIIILYISKAFLIAEVKNQQKIIAGYIGEMKMLNYYKQLPDDIVVFYSVDLNWDNKSSQIDFILVGPFGVFLNEVKNWSGTISGNANDNQLTITKISYNGEKHEKTKYNPIKQIGTHIYRTANLLKSSGYNIYVKGFITYVSNNVNIEITNSDNVPVFNSKILYGDRLYQYMMGECKKPLTNEEIFQIADYLKNKLYITKEETNTQQSLSLSQKNKQRGVS